MRSAIAHAAVAAQRTQKGRQRSKSLSTIPPSETSEDYLPHLAAIAASILYRSPLPSRQGRPIYVLNAAAFPDAFEVDYDTLLSYVLARLPGEDELLSGTEYEIVFLAGGQPDNATSEKKAGPGMGWYLQAYHVLSRATRKRLQKLYIVHPRTWVRVLIGVFGTIVSPKFRRKIVHFNTLSQLALQIPIERILIPPTAYLHDRKLSPDIYVPFVTGKRAFGVRHPLPKNIDTGKFRLPRLLRETTSFLMMSECIKMEGIFRIPPNATLGGVLKEAYDRGQHFIVWKEKSAAFVQPGMPQTLLDEVRLEDTYGVHQAASLIKQWYRDLREPVFPESTYETIKEQYGNLDIDIQPEDLVNLILPESELSPLSVDGRKVLTRHLLPMLSEVAAYETHNKMNAENLAICFSMCLVCGSNQLEDVKVSSIVKRILKAAIEMWPELRAGMGLSAKGFFADLQAPDDSRDYEDPLEEEMPPRSKVVEDDEFASESFDEQRIVMQDSEDVPEPERKPTLPPRPSREALPPLAPVIPQRRPVSRPPSSGNGSPVKTAPEVPPPFPKRKPAPPTVDPPRYSTVFDADGNSLFVADSPASYAPADGFGPPRHGLWSYDESAKKGFPVEPTPPAPTIEVPKRKAVSSEHSSADIAQPPPNPLSTARSASESAALAQAAAQRAAANLGQQAASAFAERQPPTPTLKTPGATITHSPETTINDDSMFRKPSWPASSRPIIQPQSLAKPLLPRQSNTFPLQSNNNLATSSSNVPKHRAPSPGLLKRMSEMDVGSSSSTTSNGSENPTQSGTSSLKSPRRLDLKKPSVDDLRRLYEERVTTVEGLAKADAARRNSTSG